MNNNENQEVMKQQEVVKEGLKNFSNTFNEDIINKCIEDGDEQKIDNFRKSIYNFNREGINKQKIRSKVFDIVEKDKKGEDLNQLIQDLKQV